MPGSRPAGSGAWARRRPAPNPNAYAKARGASDEVFLATQYGINGWTIADSALRAIVEGEPYTVSADGDDCDRPRPDRTHAHRLDRPLGGLREGERNLGLMPAKPGIGRNQQTAGSLPRRGGREN